MSEAEINFLIAIYDNALKQLAIEYRKWGSNHYRYRYWTTAQRLKWIDHIEAKAVDGLPMAQEIVTKVIALRMML